MSRHILIATFQCEEDLLDGVRRFRRRGLKIVDAYTPYPVHGLDEVLGLRPSRLSWLCAGLGAAGAGLALWFQNWTSGIDWPINVGGKPLNSLPAYVPVVFESMVLAAGVGTALAFFAVSRLFPGRKSCLVTPHVTDDRFAVVLEETDATFSAEELRGMLAQTGTVHVEQQVVSTDGGTRFGDEQSAQPLEDAEHSSTMAPPVATVGEPNCGAGVSPGFRQSGRLHHKVGSPRFSDRFTCFLRQRLGLANLILAVFLAAVVAAAFAAGGGVFQRGWEFLPNMVWSPAYDVYALEASSPGAGTLQSPAPGIVARGEIPLPYANTDEDAVLAGKELKNPYARDNASATARGTFVFENFCTSCHGQAGASDGPVAQRGYPPPPNLAMGNSRTMPDGQLFHIITFGRRNMPSHATILEPEDRWKVILHIRKLQSASQPPESKTP